MLKTVDAVIDSLGGTFEAAKIAQVGPSAVSNWRSRNRIPPDHYIVISRALEAAKVEADPAIFAFTSPPSPEPA